MSYEFKIGLSESERIIKNINDMLEHRKGSIPYDRDIGIESDWKDKVVGKNAGAMLTEVNDMLNLKEERVTSKVTLSSDNSLIVEVTPNGTD